MSITIKEIAKKANVSIATVSRALNNDPKVKDETKNLVRSLADQLNYNPNILARNFVKQQSNIIGLIMPELVDEFFTEVIRGADEMAYSAGYYLMVSSSHSKRPMMENIVNFMGKGLLGGLILMAPSLSEEIEEIIKNYAAPVVLINGRKDLQSYDSVSIDNYQGAYELIQYLITEKKITEIAHICGPLGNIDAIQREQGYADALKDNKISIKKEWIIPGDFSIKGGEEAFHKLMELKKKPRAVFAANDMAAIGCYQAAEKRKLKIPNDIAIAGYDGIFVGKFLNPKLTTIQVPTNELGRTAANLLIERIKSPNKKNPKHIKISTKLRIANSC